MFPNFASDSIFAAMRARASVSPDTVVTALQFHFPALDHHGKRKGIIDVTADIGIKDNRNAPRSGRRGAKEGNTENTYENSADAGFEIAQQYRALL
jgi:hypothetical protein